LTWDPRTLLYEEQEAATTSYSGNIVSNATVRGHIGYLVINLLSFLTTNLADVTNDDNFYLVLSSNVKISSIETSLNEHI
jgi:hypothetical protein